LIAEVYGSIYGICAVGKSNRASYFVAIALALGAVDARISSCMSPHFVIRTGYLGTWVLGYFG